MFYVGTYTGKGSKGIYRFTLDERTGQLSDQGLAVAVENPTFLVPHPNGRFVYSVNETDRFDGEPSGGLSAFERDPSTGALKELNQQVAGGTGTCHVSLDATGKFLLAANYQSGSVSVHPVAEDGKLGDSTAWVQHHGSGPDPGRQEGPHAHYFATDPSNNFALAVDLGIDQILVSRLDVQTGRLTPVSPPFTKVEPGSGPRHLGWSPSGQHVYLANELGSTAMAFGWNGAAGRLEQFQTLRTTPDDFRGVNYPAEVAVHPSGRWLYLSNRGHNSIVHFHVDAQTGQLSSPAWTPVEGDWPRHFELSPSARWMVVANQNSSNLTVLRVDPETGGLTSAGEHAQVGSPVCVRFVR